MKTELEMRIKTEYDNMEVDSSHLLQLHKSPAQATYKRTRTRRPYRLAAAIVIIIALITTSVAVAHYMGSFDRLLGIIGPEHAESLQPMGDVIDEIITPDNFRIEVVAVGVDANVVDIYLTIEDLISNRLDGGFIVAGHLRMLDCLDPASPVFLNEYINRTDDGIMTLHSRNVFLRPITDQVLQLSLLWLSHSHRIEVVDIDFDLSATETYAPAAWLWDTPILPPHMHNIDITFEDFNRAGRIQISSIGIIDGKLHIQENYDDTALSGWQNNTVHVLDPYGEVVHPLLGSAYNTESISFGISQDGDIYNDRGFNFATFHYRENIFEVDLDRLSEYGLSARFFVHDATEMTLSVSFEVELPDEISEFLVVDELEVLLECRQVTISEVRVSPFTVMIEVIESVESEYSDAFHSTGLMLFHPNGGVEFPQIMLNMADGSSVEVASHTRRSSITYEGGGGGVISASSTEVMVIQASRIDVDEVVSIEIAGVTIMLR